jgi:hemerythrin
LPIHDREIIIKFKDNGGKDNVACIKWSAELSVNIKEIDEQHQTLIGIINRMNDMVAAGNRVERSKMRRIFAELADYTAHHFKTEEELFFTHHYPQGEEHKKQHNDLAMQLLELQIGFSKGEKDVSQEMMNFLNDWLIKHILGSDKEYAVFLNGKGIF